MHRVKRQVFEKYKAGNALVQVFNDRCDGDLMFQLFERPRTCIDQLFKQLCKLIEKKLSPDLQRSRMYTDMVKQDCNMVCKTFFVLLIIAREEEAQQVVMDAYNEKTSIWKDKSASRFQTNYIPRLKELFNQQFHERFGEVNIVQIMHFYVNEAQKLYMSL
jgi:hypothetical protein